MARQKLRPMNIDHEKHLSREVARLAEGVFLWAAIVVQSLVAGAASRDTPDMLFRRLSAKPKEMDQLFSQMLSEVHEVHRESLNFYLQFLKFEKQWAIETVELYEGDEYDPNHLEDIKAVCHLTAAQLHTGIDSYKQFGELCEDTEVQIVAQSAGLLEVVDFVAHTVNGKIQECSGSFSKSTIFCLRVGQGVSWDNGSKSLGPLCRKRCTVNSLPEYAPLIRCEHRQLHWIHRSAYDFVESPEGQSLLHIDEDPSTTIKKILLGMLRYLVIAPSYLPSHPLSYTHTQERVSNLVRVASVLCRDAKDTLSRFLYQLRDLTIALDPNEFRLFELSKLRRDSGGLLIGEVAFWERVLHINCTGRAPLPALFEFVQENFYDRSAIPKGKYLINPLIAHQLDLFMEEIFPGSWEPELHSDQFEVILRLALKEIRSMFEDSTTNRSDRITFVFPRRLFVQSCTCRWPAGGTSHQTSSGHAYIMWHLVDICLRVIYDAECLDCLCNPHGLIPIATEIFSILDLHLEIGTVPGLNNPLRNWIPHRLTIEFSHELMQHIHKHAKDIALSGDSLQPYAGIHVLCFPQTLEGSGILQQAAAMKSNNRKKRRFLRNLNTFDDHRQSCSSAEGLFQNADDRLTKLNALDIVRRAAESEYPPPVHLPDISVQHIVVHPSQATIQTLVTYAAKHIFQSGQVDHYDDDGELVKFEGADVVREDEDPYIAFADVLMLVREDIVANEQGLDATQQLYAIACVLTERDRITDLAD